MTFPQFRSVQSRRNAPLRVLIERSPDERVGASGVLTQQPRNGPYLQNGRASESKRPKWIGAGFNRRRLIELAEARTCPFHTHWIARSTSDPTFSVLFGQRLRCRTSGKRRRREGHCKTQSQEQRSKFLHGKSPSAVLLQWNNAKGPLRFALKKGCRPKPTQRN